VSEKQWISGINKMSYRLGKNRPVQEIIKDLFFIVHRNYQTKMRAVFHNGKAVSLMEKRVSNRPSLTFQKRLQPPGMILFFLNDGVQLIQRLLDFDEGLEHLVKKGCIFFKFNGHPDQVFDLFHA
jgi:hypothetical protein